MMHGSTGGRVIHGGTKVRIGSGGSYYWIEQR
jgi:hypothetical protein